MVSTYRLLNSPTLPEILIGCIEETALHIVRVKITNDAMITEQLEIENPLADHVPKLDKIHQHRDWRNVSTIISKPHSTLFSSSEHTNQWISHKPSSTDQFERHFLPSKLRNTATKCNPFQSNRNLIDSRSSDDAVSRTFGYLLRNSKKNPYARIGQEKWIGTRNCASSYINFPGFCWCFSDSSSANK